VVVRKGRGVKLTALGDIWIYSMGLAIAEVHRGFPDFEYLKLAQLSRAFPMIGNLPRLPETFQLSEVFTNIETLFFQVNLRTRLPSPKRRRGKKL